MDTSWMPMAQVVPLALLLLTALRSDLRFRRIPNRTVGAGLAAAVTTHAAALALSAPALAGGHWWSPLAGMATGLALFAPLHVVRACGAGDVKLMAMAGAFIGPQTAVVAMLCTLVAGGLLSLIYMCRPGVAVQTLRNVRFMLTHWLAKLQTEGGVTVDPPASTAARLPYGLAIAAGVVAALAIRPGPLWPHP